MTLNSLNFRNVLVWAPRVPHWPASPRCWCCLSPSISPWCTYSRKYQQSQWGPTRIYHWCSLLQWLWSLCTSRYDDAQATVTHKKSHIFAYCTWQYSLSNLSHLCQWTSLCSYCLWYISSPCSELSWIHPCVLSLHARDSILYYPPSRIERLLAKKPLHHGTSTLCKYPATRHFHLYCVHSTTLQTSKHVIVHGILDTSPYHTWELLEVLTLIRTPRKHPTWSSEGRVGGLDSLSVM